MEKIVFSRGLSMLAFLVLFTLGARAEVTQFEEKASDKPTVIAVQKCLADIQAMIDQPSAEGQDLKCKIPVVVDEEELDLILNQAFDIKKLNKYRERFASFSSKMTKSLINARSATCNMLIEMKREKVLQVIMGKDTHITFAKQPLSCDVKTKSKKIEKVSFTFRPVFESKGRCIKAFKPQMADIKTPCKLCRLYVSAKLVGLWVNHFGKNLTPVFNQILYKKCS